MFWTGVITIKGSQYLLCLSSANRIVVLLVVDATDLYTVYRKTIIYTGNFPRVEC